MSFIFSSVHGIVLSQLKTDSCSVSEHIKEINSPSNHGDSCDMHFAFHLSFTLVEQYNIVSPMLSYQKIHFKDYNYQNPLILGTIKPPTQS